MTEQAYEALDNITDEAINVDAANEKDTALIATENKETETINNDEQSLQQRSYDVSVRWSDFPYVQNFKLQLDELDSPLICNCCDMRLMNAAECWLAIYVFKIILSCVVHGVLTDDAGENGLYFYTLIIAIIIDVIGLFVVFYALYGLHICDAECLYFCWIYFVFVWIICLVAGIIMIINGEYIYIIGAGIWFLCQYYMVNIFYKIQLWAKYFKSGGVYDSNMIAPPNSTSINMMPSLLQENI